MKKIGKKKKEKNSPTGLEHRLKKLYKKEQWQ